MRSGGLVAPTAMRRSGSSGGGGGGGGGGKRSRRRNDVETYSFNDKRQAIRHALIVSARSATAVNMALRAECVYADWGNDAISAQDVNGELKVTRGRVAAAAAEDATAVASPSSSSSSSSSPSSSSSSTHSRITVTTTTKTTTTIVAEKETAPKDHSCARNVQKKTALRNSHRSSVRLPLPKHCHWSSKEFLARWLLRQWRTVRTS